LDSKTSEVYLTKIILQLRRLVTGIDHALLRLSAKLILGHFVVV